MSKNQDQTQPVATTPVAPAMVTMTKEELQALLAQAATQAVSSVQNSQAQAQAAVQAVAAQAAPAPAPVAPAEDPAKKVAELEAQLKEANRPRTLEEFDRLYTGMSDERQLAFRKANGLLDAGIIRDLPVIRTIREYRFGHYVAGSVHAAEEGTLITGGVLALLGKLRIG